MTESLHRQLKELNSELHRMKQENAAIDIKFMNLYRVLEKIKLSETHKEAVSMANSVLKSTAIDHSTESVIAVPPLDPQKHRKGPKTKDSKKGASLF